MRQRGVNGAGGSSSPRHVLTTPHARALNSTGTPDSESREGELAFILVFICCGLLGFIILVMFCSRHKTTKQERQARKYVLDVERQRRKSMEALVRSSVRTGGHTLIQPGPSNMQRGGPSPAASTSRSIDCSSSKDMGSGGDRVTSSCPAVATLLPTIRVERSDGEVVSACVDG